MRNRNGGIAQKRKKKTLVTKITDYSRLQRVDSKDLWVGHTQPGIGARGPITTCTQEKPL